MIRDVFRLARENAPAIVFIDGIDAIATKRFDAQTGADREVQRILLELLNQMDGFDQATNVKVIMARSRRPAVLRRLHAIDATLVHQTRSWVVSFSILRSFGPRRETRHSTRPHAGHRDAASPGRCGSGPDLFSVVEARGGESRLLFVV